MDNNEEVLAKLDVLIAKCRDACIYTLIGCQQIHAVEEELNKIFPSTDHREFARAKYRAIMAIAIKRRKELLDAGAKRTK